LKVNLILSGGAGRGIAHLGVIKAFEEAGFEIRALSGSSAGAIVSVFYAQGYSPEQMLGIVKRTRWFSLFRPRIPRSGLLNFSRAHNYLKEFLEAERIEDLGKKVYICATDLLSARSLYFSEGELVPILLGSCALPGIFEPVRYGKFYLIDGGVMNNLPVEPFEKEEGIKVGVDVNPLEKIEKPGGIVSVIVRSFFLAVRSNVEKRKELCDIVITPDLVKFSPLEVGKADRIFELGYRSAVEAINKLA
jgi:NTE family protein